MAEPAFTGRLPSADVRAVYISKVISLVLILAMIWLLKWFVSPTTLASAISHVILLVLVPNLVVVGWSGEVPVAMFVLSFAADIFALTAAIHYGGGVDQVSGPLLYSLIIGLAGLMLSERAAYVAAGASAAVYGLLVWAEYTEFLPHHVSYSRPPDRQVATVLMVSLFLLVFAWLVSYVVRHLRAGYQGAEELRAEAVSALSHDLKNPLGAIHSYAQMMPSGTAEEQADYLRRIEFAAQHALDLVRNVLDAAAVEGRPLAPERAVVQLNELVRQIYEFYRPSAEAKGIELRASLAAVPAISADPQLLARAIGNLMSNAIKYTGNGGTIELRTAATAEVASVGVRDTGPGIAVAEHARLFQKFSRIAGSRGVDGTGLGLYIVRRIAEAHGGSVSVVSAVGQGSTFTLHLPVDA